jgi:large subunit ribosomal protein L21
MYAVIKTGGKQYKVSQGDQLVIEKVEGEAGDTISFDQVLMLASEDGVTVGSPLVEGAQVVGELVELKRSKKIIIFKKRRRQNYRRKKGHRQEMTVLRISEILTGGARPSGKKAAKPAAKAETGAAAEAGEALPAGSVTNDVSRISGLGPKAKAKLAEHGIETLEPLAAMDDVTREKLEAAELLSKAEKDDWQGQAKKLLEELNAQG